MTALRTTYVCVLPHRLTSSNLPHERCKDRHSDRHIDILARPSSSCVPSFLEGMDGSDSTTARERRGMPGGPLAALVPQHEGLL